MYIYVRTYKENLILFSHSAPVYCRGCGWAVQVRGGEQRGPGGDQLHAQRGPLRRARGAQHGRAGGRGEFRGTWQKFQI